MEYVGIAKSFSGWLMVEENVEGSDDSWKKRWCSITNLQIDIFKNPKEKEPLQSYALCSVKELAFGTTIAKTKQFGFSFTTVDGDIVKFSAETDEQREEWVQKLRMLVPIAKIEATQYQEAVETIMRDTYRIKAFPSLKPYVNNLKASLTALKAETQQICSVGIPGAKMVAVQVSLTVDACNSLLAKIPSCNLSSETVQKIQEDILERISSIVKNVGMIVTYAKSLSFQSSIRGQVIKVKDNICASIDKLIKYINTIEEGSEVPDEKKEKSKEEKKEKPKEEKKEKSKEKKKEKDKWPKKFKKAKRSRSIIKSTDLPAEPTVTTTVTTTVETTTEVVTEVIEEVVDDSRQKSFTVAATETPAPPPAPASPLVRENTRSSRMREARILSVYAADDTDSKLFIQTMRDPRKPVTSKPEPEKDLLAERQEKMKNRVSRYFDEKGLSKHLSVAITPTLCAVRDFQKLSVEGVQLKAESLLSSPQQKQSLEDMNQLVESASNSAATALSRILNIGTLITDIAQSDGDVQRIGKSLSNFLGVEGVTLEAEKLEALATAFSSPVFSEVNKEITTASTNLDAALSCLITLKLPKFAEELQLPYEGDGTDSIVIDFSTELSGLSMMSGNTRMSKNFGNKRGTLIANFDSFLEEFNKELSSMSANETSDLYCGRRFTTFSENPYSAQAIAESKKILDSAAHIAYNATASLAQTNAPPAVTINIRVEELKRKIQTLEDELQKAKFELEQQMILATYDPNAKHDTV